MKKQSNEITKRKRIKSIIDLMSQGKYNFEIVDILSKEWDCSSRNVYKYINSTKKVLGKEISESDRSEFISKLNYLYSLALEKKDIKTANAVLANIGKFTIGEKQEIVIDYKSKFPGLDDDNNPTN